MTAATGPGNAEQVAAFIKFENLAIGAANSLPIRRIRCRTPR
ncbi:hypothetical protein [Amycolatopsis sp. Hca4]|nr:hypothetical protein [Amycolatopsis sp. Hca4]